MFEMICRKSEDFFFSTTVHVAHCVSLLLLNTSYYLFVYFAHVTDKISSNTQDAAKSEGSFSFFVSEVQSLSLTAHIHTNTHTHKSKV